MIRVLFVVGQMNRGGAETFLMKIYRAIDKNRFHFDFLTSTDKSTYSNEIQLLGGNIFVGYRRRFHFLKMFNFIRKTVKKEEYKTVFFSQNSAIVLFDLIAAKLGGAKYLILRSSSSRVNSRLLCAANYVFRPLTNLFVDLKLAPSQEAAKWLFGRSTNVHMLKNGLNLAQYRYDEDIRENTRQNIGVGNKFVVCHIGRFLKVKNHQYLIKIFDEINSAMPQSVLMLIGKGPEIENIKHFASYLGLSNKILFLGERDDIGNLLMAADIFVFPSIYEGMPNAVIEAQATGLPCIVSDTVTHDVKIIEAVEFLSITADPALWAKLIISYSGNKIERENAYLELYKAGYDISVSAEFLEEYFERIDL